MDEKALFLKFWDKEAAATRKVIARIPQAKSDYRADLIHHRGQLSTYLRPMGSTVPAIYGPSADEES